MGRRLALACAVTAVVLLLAVHSWSAVAGSAPNLLTNPGFEAGLSGWTPAPSTATIILTAPAHSGVWAAGLTKETKTGSVTLAQTVAVEAGASYELSGWVLWRDDGVSNARLRLSWLDPSGERLGERVELDAPARRGDYQSLRSASLIAPAGAVEAVVECYTYLNSPNPTEPSLFDDLALALLALPPTPTAEPPTATPTPTATGTPSPTPSPSETSTPTVTASPSTTGTHTASPSATPSSTADPAATDTPTLTASATPGAAATPSPTATVEPTATATLVATATATLTVEPSPSFTATTTPSPTPTAEDPATPTPTASPTLAPPPTPTATAFAASVRLNELLPAPKTVDWDGDGTADAADEWVELFNAGAEAVDLSGWLLDDVAEGGSRPYTLPAETRLEAGSFLLLFRRQTGVALNNDSDAVRLLWPNGTPADTFWYSHPPADASYSRDAGDVWHVDWPPSPGESNQPPPATPTPSPTPTASATVTATPTASPTTPPAATASATPFSLSVRLNEFLPAPKTVDWDGDGMATAEDEWIELANLGTELVDLSGWQLDDVAEGGSRPYTLPAGTRLSPGGFLLLFRRQTGVALNNDSDAVRLLWPDGTPVDTFWYSRPPADASYSRDPANGWHTGWPPSPGGPNVPPTPTPTPTPTPLPTATASPSATATPRPSPTATATISPDLPLRLNELLPAPKNVDWDGDGAATTGDEWIELYNGSQHALDLGGWQLDDVADGGSRPYTLPAGMRLSPGGFLLLFRRQTGIALNNSGDEVRLLRPDGSLHDSFAFTQSAPDASYSRGADGRWHADWPPSPGAPNQPPVASPTPSATLVPPPSPTPTRSPTISPQLPVQLNEFLPAPQAIDWDGDGTPTAEDEWIELANVGTEPVELSGWQLDDLADGGSRAYTLPAGTRLSPGGFLLLFRRQTGLALNNSGDAVRLLRPDGSAHDDVAFSKTAPDASFSRDASGTWHSGWPASPGQPNRAPTPTPTGTATPRATASPTATRSPTVSPDLPIHLNELLPAPKAIDWDGDGTATASDEWIELVNAGSEAVDLGGWQLDDIAAGGSRPYTLPVGTRLAPGEHLLLFRRQTGLALNNSGDEVRLLRPDGSLHDRFAFDRAAPDASYSRDEAGAWHEGWPPSPGAANQPPSLTPSPTATATATPTLPATASPTFTADAPVLLNEVLPAPKNVDWDGDGAATASDEWIELANEGAEAIDLGGWQLDDIAEGGSTPYTLPAGTRLAPGELLVLFRRQTKVALNNDGDEVRLLRPDGSLHDHFRFAHAAPDASFSRDSSGAWHAAWPPSPARPNAAPTPTPTPHPVTPLVISEIVYDGTQPGDGDEFVELFNPTGDPVNLDGWGVGDEVRGGGGEGFYRFPGHPLAPGAVLVVARSATAFQARFGALPDFEFEPGTADLPEVPNLTRDTTWGRGRWALSDSGDEVILLDAHNRRVDALAFRNGDFAAIGMTGHDISAPAPRSLNRVADWRGTHLNDILVYESPSPGRVLLPPPPPAPVPAPTVGDGLFAFWGTLHAHSTYSDGSGPPAYAYAVARANGQHFLALSDHSNWFEEREWAALGAAADAADAPGSFVALRAFEWTSRDSGHINVFASDDFVSRDEPDGDSLADLYAFLAARPAALGEFNHPFPGDFDGLRFEPGLRDQMALLEVGNGRPQFFRRSVEAYWQALFKGWRVGAAANLDTETADWGVDGALRTGILAPRLERGALLDAIRARRTFASEDQTLALALRGGAAWMGSEIAAGPLSLTVLASDAEGEEATLELWREGAAVVSTTLRLGATPQAWTLALDARPGEVLVARAVQADGDQAWTSPLFIQGEWQPPGLLITEVLPAPREVDFNGDGLRDSNDEFIELHNPLGRPVGLGGWQLDDADGGSRPFTLPIGTTIPPRGYLVFHKSATGVALDQIGDHARLIAPDGTLVDDVSWPRFPGYDRSLSRTRAGSWISGAAPSPGGPLPEPAAEDGDSEAEPTPGGGGATGPADTVSVAEARRLPLGRRVTVQGQVSAPPGIFGETTMYLQAGGAGLRVYLRGAALPALALGDWVEVGGQLGSYYGERELRASDAAAVRRLGPGTPPVPLALATGQLGAGEGQLVWLRGRVTGWSRNRWTLDDGSGPATVVLRATTGLRRPWLERGEIRAVVGIVVRYRDELQLLPRAAADLAPDSLGPPRLLPETGGE